jgi:hypothetical protein
MDRDRNDLVKQVFQEALEKGDEAERRAFVASASERTSRPGTG